MGKSIYGVWDGVVHDFRRIPQGGQITPVEGLDNFDPNNPTKAFIAVVVNRSNSRNCGDTDEEVVAKHPGYSSRTISIARASWEASR